MNTKEPNICQQKTICWDLLWTKTRQPIYLNFDLAKAKINDAFQYYDKRNDMQTLCSFNSIHTIEYENINLAYAMYSNGNISNEIIYYLHCDRTLHKCSKSIKCF